MAKKEKGKKSSGLRKSAGGNKTTLSGESMKRRKD